MKIDLGKFEALVESGMILCQKHPDLPLLIWNYSKQCQYDRFWTSETMMARGLITDLDGDIVARPFPKFFNYEEHTGEDSKLPALPIESFEVFDKLDGSLGILYWNNFEHDFSLATRGSFTSEQAVRGTKIIRKKLRGVEFELAYTYLFEIIYPENRIVVDYDELEDVVLLAVIDTRSGEELDSHKLETIAPPFNVVKRFDGVTDLSKLKEQFNRSNSEGFVVRFSSGTRVKMKYEEYVRLHRLVTGVNAKTIWELLKNNDKFDDLLERVPDEFYNWVDNTRNKLIGKFLDIEAQANGAYVIVKTLPTRREQAEALVEHEYKAIVFSMLDGKDYRQAIWKRIRPYADKPFRDDES